MNTPRVQYEVIAPCGAVVERFTSGPAERRAFTSANQWRNITGMNHRVRGTVLAPTGGTPPVQCVCNCGRGADPASSDTLGVDVCATCYGVWCAWQVAP